MVITLNQTRPDRLQGSSVTALDGGRLFELACNIFSGDALSERSTEYLERILPANTLFFLADDTKYLHPTGFEPFPPETIQAMLKNDSAGIFCRRMYHDETGADSDCSLCVARLGEDKNNRDISCGIVYSDGWGDTEKFEGEFYGLISKIRRFYDAFRSSRAALNFLNDEDCLRYIIDHDAGVIVSRRVPRHRQSGRAVADWDRLIADQFLTRISDQNFDSSQTVIFDRHIRNLNIARFQLLDYGFTLLSFQPLETDFDEIGEYDRIVRNFSHQMCNKLAALQASASQLLLGRDGTIGEKEAALARIILSASERMDNLLSRLHQYSRCANENEEKFDFYQLLQQMIQSYRRGGTRIALDSEISEYEMTGDAVKITLALEELLTNAVEAGGIDQEAAITLRNGPDGPEMTITNSCAERDMKTGNMSRELGPQPFTSAKPNRAGMGLCISERIINEHRGTLSMAGDTAGRVTVKVRFFNSSNRR